jgi:UDP-N-acetylmuramoylalanine--D-glutamate ligase
VSRLRGFADLSGLTVGVWGVGIEGTAAARRLDTVAGTLVLVDDVADPSRGITATQLGGLEQLFTCDVVLKSPGIPRRRDDVLALEAAGVVVTSALNLWLHETDRSRVIAVTGTKGKSTTTSLITFFLNLLGEGATSAGNIGAPPYDPDFSTSGWTVLEVSSFQAVDIEVAPPLVIVTSLGEDHLDWHGSLEQYVDDKLSLTRADGEHVTLLADDQSVRSHRAEVGGEVRVVDDAGDDLVGPLGLLGAHNASNVALALGAVRIATGVEPAVLIDVVRRHASEFSPLPGRLTLVGELRGVRYVDDGLATAPLPTVAALAVFRGEPLALIVGGYDRGVDYRILAEALASRNSPTTVVAMPDVGQRIAHELVAHTGVHVRFADDMRAAVDAARSAVSNGGGGVVVAGRAEFWSIPQLARAVRRLCGRRGCD